MEGLLEFLKGISEQENYLLDNERDLFIILHRDELLYYLMDLRMETFIVSLKEIVAEGGIIKTYSTPIRYLLNLPNDATKMYNDIQTKLISI